MFDWVETKLQTDGWMKGYEGRVPFRTQRQLILTSNPHDFSWKYAKQTVPPFILQAGRNHAPEMSLQPFDVKPSLDSSPQLQTLPPFPSQPLGTSKETYTIQPIAPKRQAPLRSDEHAHPILTPSFSRASHFTIPATLPCCVVRLQHSCLRLVGLRECVTALLAHTLDLANFADGFLELLHAGPIVLDVEFLNLLDMVVCLRIVHSLCVFPREIPEKTQDG